MGWLVGCLGGLGWFHFVLFLSSLARTYDSFIQLDCLASKPPGSACLFLPCWDYKCVPPGLAFYLRSPLLAQQGVCQPSTKHLPAHFIYSAWVSGIKGPLGVLSLWTVLFRVSFSFQLATAPWLFCYSYRNRV